MENGLTMDGLKNFIVVCRKCKNLEVWGTLADMSSNSYITDADSYEIKNTASKFVAKRAKN